MENHRSIILVDYTKFPPCSALVGVCVCSIEALAADANIKIKAIDVVPNARCGVYPNSYHTKAIILN